MKQRRVIGMDSVRLCMERREFILTLWGVGSERINRQSGAGGFTGLMGFGPAGRGSIAGSGSVGMMVAPAARAASPVVE
jgi:hypothetical protein